MNKVKTLIKILLLLTTVTAMANDLGTNNDASLRFLSLVFGSMNGLLPQSPVVLIPIGIKYFNYGLMAFVAGMISYTFTISAIKTSNQGKMLGKQGGGITAVFRAITSISALSPIPAYNGYSLMQVFIIKLVITGVGTANSVWDTAKDYVDKNTSIISSNSPDFKETNNIVALKGDDNVLKYAYCLAINTNKNPSTGVNSTGRTIYTVNVIEQNGKKKPLCRNIKFLVPEEITNENIKSAEIIINDYLLSIQDLAKTSVNENTFEKSQHYIYSRMLKNNMTNKLSSLVTKPEEPPELRWFESWIFAAANFNKMLGSQQSQKNDQDPAFITISKVTDDDSASINEATDNYSDFLEMFKKPNTETEIDKDDYNPYLNAVITVMPQYDHKNKEKVNEYVKKLIAEDKAYDRGEAIVEFGGGKYSGDELEVIGNMASDVFLEGWDFSMLGIGTFDLDNGPYGLKERDATVTRNIQIFLFQIYASWNKNIVPSKYRDSINPLQRLKQFGIDSSNAGINFIANMTQDTFLASMDAQMKATSGSLGYMMKSLLMKPSKSILYYLASALRNIPLFGEAIYWTLIVIVILLNGVSSYFTMMAALPQLLMPLIKAARLMYIGLAISASVPIIILGMMFAVYVPFIPYLVFLFSAIGWIITVIEAVVAAPIVASGMSNPQGHDFLGKAQQIIMLLAAVYIRPICIVIGFIMAIFLFNASSYILDFTFFPMVEHYVKGLKPDNQGMSMAVIIMMYAYGYLLFCIARFSFSLIHMLPTYIVRWIGMQPVSGGEEEAMESVEASMKDAYSSGLQGASAGIQQLRN